MSAEVWTRERCPNIRTPDKVKKAIAQVEDPKSKDVTMWACDNEQYDIVEGILVLRSKLPKSPCTGASANFLGHVLCGPMACAILDHVERIDSRLIQFDAHRFKIDSVQRKTLFRKCLLECDGRTAIQRIDGRMITGGISAR